MHSSRSDGSTQVNWHILWHCNWIALGDNVPHIMCKNEIVTMAGKYDDIFLIVAWLSHRSRAWDSILSLGYCLLEFRMFFRWMHVLWCPLTFHSIWVGYAKLPQDVNDYECAWYPAMVWHHIQVDFPPHTAFPGEPRDPPWPWLTRIKITEDK